MLLNADQEKQRKDQLSELANNQEFQLNLNILLSLKDGLPQTQKGMQTVLKAFRGVEFSARHGVEIILPLAYQMEDDEDTQEIRVPKGC